MRTFKQAISSYLAELGVNDISLMVVESDKLEGDAKAQSTFGFINRIAIVEYSPDIEPGRIEYFALHEALEILLMDLRAMAGSAFQVHNDTVDEHIHRVINRLINWRRSFET